MARLSTVRNKQRAKLTPQQKKERRDKRVTLATALANTRETFTQTAVNLAETHGWTIKWTRTQLLLHSGLRERRRVNPWNAFVKHSMHKANSSREKGDRYQLPKFIATFKSELLAEYKKLTPVDKQALMAKVQEARDAKTSPMRANPKAVNQVLVAAFTKMDHEWTALCTKTGMEGFFIAVRGTVEDHSEPKLFFTEKAEKFVRAVLDVEPRRLALRLEAWVVSGINLSSTANRQRPLNNLISNCRTIIQDELEDILVNRKVKGKVKMNYTNYELQIVERYGVALVGWPVSGPVRNPSKVGGRKATEKLLSALEAELCKWVKLTDEEWTTRITQNKARQAAGEPVYHARRARGSKSGATSKATVTSDDDDDSD